MQRLYSMFPRGGPGVGLVSLRLSALASLPILAEGDGHWSITVLTFVLGAGFLAGLMTPAVSALGIAAMLVVFSFGTDIPVPASLTLLLQSIALILLGPGAYSLDARLYARRIIDVDGSD
jgi:uncharacterized membrane protein YphA (DoxX/SURF4 family)